MDKKLAEALVEAFDAVFGFHDGLRPAHARGICCSCTFTPSPQAQVLTRAAHLQGDPVPATVRFSPGSGDPGSPDGSREPLGMAVKFHLPGDVTTDIVSITWPVFVVRTPEDALEFMRVRAPDPVTGMPDFAALSAFFEARPESHRIGRALLKGKTPASYLQAEYHALHAYRFVAADGTFRYGRYRWEPELEVTWLTPEEAAAKSPDYMELDLRARLPGRFALRITLAGEGDNVTDPTAEWKLDDHESIIAGHLEVLQPVEDPETSCERLIFDPTRVVDGIEPSSDPVLLARPQAYHFSSERRLKARG